MPVRIPVVVLALVIGLGCGVVGVAALSAPPVGRAAERPAVHPVDDPVPGERFAVGVLHAWDARRAEAWKSGDPQELAALYAAGSEAGAADVALLHRYVARGLVVRDMRTQVLGARVLVARPGRLELEVTDRLAGATAVSLDGAAARLPRDAATTRRLVLRRVGARWLMVSVSAVTPSRR
jgi:hypothetical protein